MLTTAAPLTQKIVTNFHPKMTRFKIFENIIRKRHGSRFSTKRIIDLHILIVFDLGW